MKAAIYTRVSTRDKGQSTDMQTDELQAYAKARGWEIVETYTDTASGSKTERHRPGLRQLLEDAKRRKFGAVVVYRFDRFARSLLQLVEALNEFRALNIDFVSIHEAVDTSTPNGRLIFGIFASIAEFERELIRDRVKSGLDAARKRGKTLGRPGTSPTVRARIADLHTQGLTVPQIAAAVKVSTRTVFRVLA